MRVLQHDVGDVTVLELDGRLILEEGDLPLRDAVDRLVAAGRVKIVLDLAHVTRVDSAGVGMLVCKYLTVFRKGGRLKLLHLTDRAKELMRMTKLAGVFEVFLSEADAIRSFAPLTRSRAR